MRDYSSGVLGRTDITMEFAKLERKARREAPHAKLERSADLRYKGQSYELNVPWPAGRNFAAFHKAHAQAFGYAIPGREVEVVTIRVRARLATSKPRLRRQPATASASRPKRRVWTGGRFRRIPVLDRSQLTAAARTGPALLLDYGSTTLVPAGWQLQLDRAGNLILQR